MPELTPVAAVLGFRDACEHGDAELSRNEANGGIGMWCYACRSWVTRQKGYDRAWLGKDHPALRGIDLAALPTIGARVYRKCQGLCAQLAHCELHHLAPRAFFGDECDRWPTAWLCRPCHDRWHTLVTPGLCTSYEAEAHARMLIDYLGLDRAAHLTQMLTQIGRARRAGAA
jgi:hypothetical protein